MKLLVGTKSNINKDRNWGNGPHFKITEVVLIHCIILNNDYQQDLRVLYTFVPNNSFGKLLDISPKKFINFKNFSFRIFISVVYLSKFEAARNRRYKHYFRH